MIKHVILDMGGVLLSFEPQIALDAFCETQEQKKIVQKALFESPFWHDADAGIIKDRELFHYTKETVSPEHWDALRQCCKNWDICMNPIEGAREFCHWLKQAGLGVYVLSNASDKFYEYFGKFLPLEFFDGIIVSSDIKMMKPDHEIFAYVMDKYGLRKEECLFVDDSLKNAEGAKSFGMNACHFTGDFDAVKAYL